MVHENIDQKLLKQGIKAVRELNAKFYEDATKKKPLLEDEKDSTLYLQFSLKKIPKVQSIKMIKIKLPHSLLKDDSETCLIVGDLDKTNHKAEIEPDILHYKELLKKHDINNISEVLTLRQLRTEYKPYEAKQKLCAAFDVFLADRKIAECLPKVLGRHFFKKRKFPIQITLNTPNLKQQVEKALSTKVFNLTGFGNSCTSEVAYLYMSDIEISENIIAMVKDFCDALPGSWDNVLGIYLKTALSKAIPLYMSYDDPSALFIKEEECDNSFEIDELSTEPDKLVKVYKDGSVRTVRIKRIAETCETADNKEDLKRKKIKKDIDDSADDFIDAHLNEESTKKIKNSKHKKKENSMFEQEIENTLPSNDGKVETSDISEDLKRKKKKKSTIVHDSIQNSVDAHVNDETSGISGDLKRKKMNKKTVVHDNIQNLVNAHLNGETSDISGDLKRMKKKKNSVVQDNIQNLVNADLNGETSDISGNLKKKKERIKAL